MVSFHSKDLGNTIWLAYLSASSSAGFGAPAAFLVSIDARVVDIRVLGRPVIDVEVLVPVAEARGVALETVEGLEAGAGRFAAAEVVVDVGAVLVRRADEVVPEVADERAEDEAVPVVDRRLPATLPGLLSSLAAASVVVRLTLEEVVEVAPGRVGGLLMVLLVDVREAEEEVGFVAVEVREVAGVREVEDETVEVGRRGGAEAPVFAAEATEEVFLWEEAASGFSVSAMVEGERRCRALSSAGRGQVVESPAAARDATRRQNHTQKKGKNGRRGKEEETSSTEGTSCRCGWRAD